MVVLKGRVSSLFGILFIVIATGFAQSAHAQSIELDVMDADAWLPERTISGTASGEIDSGILSVGPDEYPFDVTDGTFAVDVELRSGQNDVVACAGSICSDTARWTLGYELEPEIFAYAEVSGRDVTLQVDVIESPNGPPATYSWSADPDNPTSLTPSSASSTTATVTIPDAAPHGEYYFDVTATDDSGRVGHARTFITASEERLDAFDIADEHSDWIDRAIVYEVTPYIFERNGKWRDVTARLDEISRLGINTLWIQPVFEAQPEGPGTSGQGYGITDYFDLRDDLGTEEDLRELVRSAKEEYGMRVLFDFVPSHTSILHPYAQDVQQRGEASPYYHFYMTEPDDAPYSQHYHTDVEPFLYYFWEDLVIIDWDQPEVYRWMREAGQKWIEEFDIDGYRIDAVWGVNARTPDAMQKWRFDLKRIKPEIFLLGESPAARSLNFDGRFDAAYDWYAELDWVSHWTWQTNFSQTSNPTIFNSEPVDARSNRLRAALTNRGEGWHPEAKVFRFLQNNDTFPFIAHHGADRTKMAGGLLFALPGIPMIYNGQEIGHERHPYGTSAIFSEGESIRDQDPYGLYEHYRDLSALRRTFPVFYSDTYEELELAPSNISGRTFAFRRWSSDMHLITVVNMGEEDASVRLTLQLDRMNVNPDETYYLTDLSSGDHRLLSGPPLHYPVVRLSGHSTGLYMLSSSEIQLPTRREDIHESVPISIDLAQNYPNPFNPSTTIAFELPEAGDVTLRVFDVLGREVATLVDRPLPAGEHAVVFDARGMASGAYFYRLKAGEFSLTRQMLLAK